MRYKDKYKCPACGQVIFDRWFTKCERCHADLPPELLYSPEEKERLRASAKHSNAFFDRVYRRLRWVWLAAVWIGGIVASVLYPHDVLVYFGICAFLTLIMVVRLWLAAHDDGLNPSLRRKKKLNQSPDPTPTSVTPAADAPVAPPSGAGHH